MCAIELLVLLANIPVGNRASLVTQGLCLSHFVVLLYTADTYHWNELELMYTELILAMKCMRY